MHALEWLNTVKPRHFYLACILVFLFIIYIFTNLVFPKYQEELANKNRKYSILNKSLQHRKEKKADEKLYAELLRKNKDLTTRLDKVKTKETFLFSFSYSKIMSKLKVLLDQAKIADYSLKSESIEIGKNKMAFTIKLNFKSDFTSLKIFLASLEDSALPVFLKNLECVYLRPLVGTDIRLILFSKQDFS